MIDLGLAQRLKASGLQWRPAPGDRFAIPKPELLGQVFTLADMTIDIQDLPSGPVLSFNGTTEWALDSVTVAEAVWLPAEHQLRTLLGRCFRGLRAVSTEPPQPEDRREMPRSYEVITDLPGAGVARFSAAIVEDAYALALLELLRLTTA